MANKRSRKKQAIPGAVIREREGANGAVSFTAQVRVKGFKSAARTFRAATKDERKKAQDDAAAWANSLVAELRGQATRGGARRDVTQLTIADLNEAFLQDPKTKAQKSYADTERLLDWWTSKFGNERVLDFGVLKLREEARPKLLQGRGNAATNRYLSALRSAWNWGRDSGYIPGERAWPRRLMLPEPRGIVRFLSDDERTRLLREAESDPTMRAAILVSIATGLRQGELLRLQWKDIDLVGAKATVQESKNGEIKVAHLVAEAVDALKALKEGAKVVSLTHPFVIERGKPLRKSLLETRWRRIRDAAKLEKFRWHDLRHTCASYLAQNGATLLEIGAVLGHKSQSMTARYSHLVKGAAVTGHDKLNEKLKGKP
jgi:integrase